MPRKARLLISPFSVSFSEFHIKCVKQIEKAFKKRGALGGGGIGEQFNLNL